MKEGGARELTPSLLDAFDLDAPADELTFSLTGAPAHGVLKAGPSHPPDPTSASPTAVASFTLRQLRQGRPLPPPFRLRRQDATWPPPPHLKIRLLRFSKLSPWIWNLHLADV